MKTIYIFGNGLDIEHGLPTDYSDFYDYLSSHKKTQKFLNDLQDAYGTYDHKWWSDLETNLGKGEWFETEFECMAENVIENMVTDDGEPMYDISSTLEIHWKPYYRFMEDLSDYILQWLSDRINLEYVFPKVKELVDSSNYFINFNYTDLLEEVYKIDAERILHIHGSVSEGEIIIGHGNRKAIDLWEKHIAEDERGMDENRKTLHKAIRDFYKYTLKDTYDIIKSNGYFFRKLQGVERVKVYGHSLNEVDIPYFKMVRDSIVPNAQWYFYAYYTYREDLKQAKEYIQERVKSLELLDKHVHIISYKEFIK